MYYLWCRSSTNRLKSKEAIPVTILTEVMPHPDTYRMVPSAGVSLAGCMLLIPGDPISMRLAG